MRVLFALSFPARGVTAGHTAGLPAGGAPSKCLKFLSVNDGDNKGCIHGIPENHKKVEHGEVTNKANK